MLDLTALVSVTVIPGAKKTLRAILHVVFLTTTTLAATVNQSTCFAQSLIEPVKIEDRLSTWLLKKAGSPGYLSGLSWRVPQQIPIQEQLKQELLVDLAANPQLNVAPAARERLIGWLQLLPVTGRIPLPIVDARWLQAHPEEDPILAHDQSIVLPVRPDTVTVLTSAVTTCRIPHRAGTEAVGYVSACLGDQADLVDFVWLIQPDGTHRKNGIGAWNRGVQEEPAPGALLWAPDRDSGWTEAFSTALARFLATQDSQSFIEAPPPGRTYSVNAPQEHPRSRDRIVTANDWGIAGLMQTPTARMSDAGEMRLTVSSTSPYVRGTIMFQPLEWLEAGFRYTTIRNQRYGPAIGQTYKDKSIDAKFRIAKETSLTPEIALGFIDMGGTGLFSSEYVVASKRTGDFDWSLGIGWGYLGSRGSVTNPLSVFGSGFKTRTKAATATIGQGTGNFNTSEWFTGHAAVFGGVQYQTSWEHLTLKLELDGHDYRLEPLGYAPGSKSPLNAGFVYRISDSFDISGAIERGNRLMFGVTFHGALDKIAMPKVLDPSPVPIATVAPNKAPNWSQTVEEIQAQTLWSIRDISIRGNELRVTLDGSAGVYWKGRIERAVRVLHRDAPPNINRFTFIHADRGLPLTEEVVLRDTWLTGYLRYIPPSERMESVVPRRPSYSWTRENTIWKNERNNFSIELTPTFQQTVGGPDGFFLYQAGVGARSEYKINDSTWLSGRLNQRILDNYDVFKVDGPSSLPRVRTDLRKYLVTSRLTIPNLQLNHVGALSENQFYSVYAGHLESMFAGFGGEWLYRPWQSAVAFGIDINHVKKRDFNQRLGTQNYSTDTGHATLYWDTGWRSVNASLSVGRYLAGDLGATLNINRHFDNGVVLGAMATKTNVSSSKFGEGSFDKGIYVSIPFDAILPQSSRETANFAWHPLTRDGGALLDRAVTLFDLTRSRDKRMFSYKEPEGFRWTNKIVDSAMPDPDRPLFKDLERSSRKLTRQMAYVPGDTLLLGGGVILASSILDKPLDKWTKRHQGGKWDSIGSAASTIPIFLGAGVGILWMGAGGEGASETAWTSIKSAAITLATESAFKMAVNRSRPELNMGATHFSESRRKGFNSGFPSQHTGVAFALATPFAENYGADWLYAIAGASALGRIQERKHFASDTVAGGLIGYGIGSLMLEQQRNANYPRVFIGSDRTLRAYWEFE